MKPPRLIVVGAIALIAASATAQAPADPSAQAQLALILRCNAIAKRRERADCYDAAAKQALGAQPAATAASVPAPKPLPAQRPFRTAAATPIKDTGAFGEDALTAARRRPQAPQARSLVAHVVSRSDDGSGYLVFDLDTGARWQIQEKTPFDLPAAGDAITIRRSMLGAYAMDVGTRSQVRVTRLQ